MSGAALAQLGWKIAAQVIANVFSTVYSQYRPTAATGPLAAGNLVTASLPGYVSVNAYQKTPLPYDPAKPRCHAVFDPAALMPGDYLVGAIQQAGVTETYFIGSIESPAPPSAIQCNCVVNVTRAARPTTFGAQGPLDTQIGTEVTVLNGWPASMLPTGRSATGAVALPGDVNLGAYTVLLPPSVPVLLRSGDSISNTSAPQAIRAIVAAATQTTEGWRLLVQQESA